jgi:hypothetical protein
MLDSSMYDDEDENDIHFKCILSKEKDKALCSILKIGDITMMLDCGCNEEVNLENLD